MKIVSLVYQYVKLRGLDDWLGQENALDDDILYLNQDEIRHLNSDFNYKHYGMYYEKMEEAKFAEDQKMNEEEKQRLDVTE